MNRPTKPGDLVRTCIDGHGNKPARLGSIGVCAHVWRDGKILVRPLREGMLSAVCSSWIRLTAKSAASIDSAEGRA